MRELDEKQREVFETLGFALVQDLYEFLYYESEGFGDFTISEFIETIMEFIKECRKEA